MKRRAEWTKGLAALLAVVALSLAFAWLLRTAGSGSAAGQQARPAGTPVVEAAEPTGTDPGEEDPGLVTAAVLNVTAAPPITLRVEASPAPIVTVGPTATPGEPGVAQIIYAIQDTREAATLWTLDYASKGEIETPRKLDTPLLGGDWLRMYEIAISPDRRYAALNFRGRVDSLDYEVWTVDLATGQARLLPELHAAGLIFLDWIPGTNQILTKDVDGMFVALMDPYGREVKELSFRDFGDGAALPEGQRFLLVPLLDPTFWLMSLDFAVENKIPIPDQRWPGPLPFGLAWSPDGQKLAYFAMLDNNRYQIRAMDADGSDVKYLSSDDAHNLFPVWSPDNTTVVYLHEVTQEVIKWSGGDPTGWDSSLWIADVETEEYRELVSSEGKACWSPAWLPDSSGIVFVSNRAGGLGDIWFVSRDGSHLQQLTTQGNIVALTVAP